MTRLDRLLVAAIVIPGAGVAALWAVATLAISAPLVVGVLGLLAVRDGAVAAHDRTVAP